MKPHNTYRHDGKSLTVKKVLGQCCMLLLFTFPVITHAQQAPVVSKCDMATAVETDGIRRMAVIVGVGDYAADRVPDLAGPAHDANRMYQLLTGRHGYDFPAANVCLLVNEDATVSAFNAAFDQLLVEQSREGDVAVVYFAGHGSQVADANGDEPDDLDETMLFHDYKLPGEGDVLDDQFNASLARLHNTGASITVIVDSCNSGSATRGDAGTFTARFFEEKLHAAAVPDSTSGTGDSSGDGAGSWVPESFPGMVILSAASDGTVALERDGNGIFTDALLQVLSGVSGQALTYAQLARRVPPLVSAQSYQIPYAQGDLSSVVFANEKRVRPVAWEVTGVTPDLTLAGPPLPGIGAGAELRLYDGASSGADFNDPSRSKGIVSIVENTGLNALARITGDTPGAEPVEIGDLAVLIRPATQYTRISVRLRGDGEPGALPESRRQAFHSELSNDAEAKLLVEVRDDAGDFELRQAESGKLVLFGPENRVRKQFDTEKAAVRNLRLHARQAALLQLRGEGGADFSDNESLQVRMKPTNVQLPCANGVWEQAGPNQPQVIPLCHAYNVEVTLQADASKPLLVGGLLFSSDGSIIGFPADGRKVLLRPGESAVFNGRRETFGGVPPLDVQDTVMVFGTQEQNPVAWHLLGETARTRAAQGAPTSSLYRAIDQYLQPNTRGTFVLDEDPDNTTWTMSSMTTRVEANSRFLAPDSLQESREYTIKNFDIRPYLPDDSQTALHKVLLGADQLASSSPVDGYSYKQHRWELASDEQNLARGIDCSRAIWFAFTRSGQKYNRTDKYIATADMVTDQSIMADEFLRCDNEPARLGDVLVYRDDTRGDGHVVMVIDPQKRIAWGSHGWDGNAKKFNIEPDTGVEYQLIRFKKDWQRWDRTTMVQKACWRYRKFSRDYASGRGLPGVEALGGSKNCTDAELCRVR